MAKPDGIASGIRVVEVGASASVACAGMVLADAGAEVILLEPPGGNPLRAEPAFRMWGRGKRSQVADLSTPEGREQALRLIGADGEAAGVILSGRLREGRAPLTFQLGHPNGYFLTTIIFREQLKVVAKEAGISLPTAASGSRRNEEQPERGARHGP